MKKIIICFMLCISLILTGCGSLLSNDSVPINTTAEIDDTDKIADENSIDVTKDKISVKRSFDSNCGTFVLKNGTLFGAKFKNELFPNSLIDKDNVKQLTNVAEFDYRETVWNDYFDRDDYTAMVYAMKKDNTFWMRGFALKKSLPKQAKHNYKEWTQVAENVKSFYAKDDPAVYIIKKDKSLWFWRKDGFYWDGKWHYDFIKIMENVKGVITDGYGYIDCVQKTDNSLWMINLKNPNESKNKFQWKNPFISVGLEDYYPYPVYPYRTMPYKVLDNVVLCKSIAVGVDQTWYAVDKDNVAWTWGFQHFGKERFLSYPLRLTENVKEIKVDVYGDRARSCVTFLKKDGSLWIQYDSGDPVYKVANNVKKHFL